MMNCHVALVPVENQIHWWVENIHLEYVEEFDEKQPKHFQY